MAISEANKALIDSTLATLDPVLVARDGAFACDGQWALDNSARLLRIRVHVNGNTADYPDLYAVTVFETANEALFLPWRSEHTMNAWLNANFPANLITEAH